MQTYDLIVIGAGSAGVRCARISAGQGAKVAIVEASKLGGTCVNLGCVPKKLFSYASHFASDFADSKGYGWEASGVFDWQSLVRAKNTEITRLNTIYGGMLEKAGVDLHQGVARYLKAENAMHQIQIAGESGEFVIAAKRVLIATGGRPTRLKCDGAEHAVVSDDLFYLDKLPKRMVMVGAGYIAVEFASIFAGLGVDVHLLLRGDQMLRAFDLQLSSWLEAAFEHRNIHIHRQTQVSSIQKNGNAFDVNCETKNADQTLKALNLEVDLVVAAIGREPAIPEGLDASVPNLLDKRGFIQVNDKFEMGLPGLYAVGDLLNGPALTPVAIKQGHWLADHWYQDDKKPLLHIPSIPTAIFTHPAIGTVGESQEQLEARGQSFKVYQSEFRPMKHTLAQNPLKAGLKLLVTDDADEKVLGMHMFGDDSPEVIQGLAVAFDMGMTKKDLDRTLGIHPTTAEEWVTMR